MRRLLPLLLLLACGKEPARPATTRTCLAEVEYRYAGVDTFSTGGSVAPEGGPLCIEFAGDRAIVTNGEALYVRLIVSSGGTGLWSLWPGGTRAEAQVFRRDGQLFFSAISGNLYWLAAPGLVIVEGAQGMLVMDYTDEDETFHAVWRP